MGHWHDRQIFDDLKPATLQIFEKRPGPKTIRTISMLNVAPPGLWCGSPAAGLMSVAITTRRHLIEWFNCVGA